VKYDSFFHFSGKQQNGSAPIFFRI